MFLMFQDVACIIISLFSVVWFSFLFVLFFPCNPFAAVVFYMCLPWSSDLPWLIGLWGIIRVTGLAGGGPRWDFLDRCELPEHTQISPWAAASSDTVERVLNSVEDAWTRLKICWKFNLKFVNRLFTPSGPLCQSDKLRAHTRTNFSWHSGQ